MQFNRDYELTISYGNVTVVIKPPMRITFDGYKSADGGLNRLNLQIYNLREDTRLKLVKDVEENRNIKLSLAVGYQGGLRGLYKGTVHKGTNERKGNDFITSIESVDGGRDLFYGFVAKTIKGKQAALDGALEGLETNKGTITQVSDLVRPKVMLGTATQVIDSFLEDGQEWFINDGKLNVLNEKGDAIKGFIPVVSADTGLLSTPSREFSKITFSTLLNPSIPLGGKVQLVSTTAPHLNGEHKVFSINAKGDYDGNDWAMTCECFAGDYATVS